MVVQGWVSQPHVLGFLDNQSGRPSMACLHAWNNANITDKNRGRTAIEFRSLTGTSTRFCETFSEIYQQNKVYGLIAILTLRR